MTFLNNWRAALPADMSAFREILPQTRGIDKRTGVIPAALLWYVRETYTSAEAEDALSEVFGAHLKPALRALEAWNTETPLTAAEFLFRRAVERPDFNQAMDALLAFFLPQLMEADLVRGDQRPPQASSIDISGTVQAGIVNIGGEMYFWGDVVVNVTYIVPKIRACPTGPKPPAHFTGRREELDHLKSVLSQGTSVAITGIQGMGGIGKTALAQQLSQELNVSAVLWSSLGPNAEAMPELLAWARHADPNFDPGDDDVEKLALRVQAILTNLINEQCPGQVLVVLDDVWEGDSVKVARLLQKAAPSNSVSLITTRSQLVVAQLRSTLVELLPMTPTDARQLLRKLLSAYPNIPDATLDELAEVVQYHPLALELAAGQVGLKERPVQEIAGLIAGYRGGIPAGSPFRDIKLELGDEREDNLAVVLSFSYDHMTNTEQTSFRSLGALAYGAPFSAALCEAIWEMEPQFTLDGLRHRAMLAIADKPGTYQQHALLRSYAKALVRQGGEDETTLNRYVDHITQQSQQFHTNPPESWGAFEPYLTPHLTEVGDALAVQFNATPTPAEALTDRALNFAVNIGGYLYNRREVRRVEWFELGLNAAKAKQDDQQQALFLNNLGGIWSALGEKRNALKYFEQAVSLYRAVGDRIGEAGTLHNIGSVWSDLGEKRKALDFFEQSLPLLRAVGDRGMVATTLNNIGVVWSDLGEKRKALDYYEQALPLRQAVGDRGGEAATLNNIGRVWSDLGEKRKALDYYEQALPLQQAVGDRGGEATTLNNIGGVWSDLGEERKALDFFEQSLPLLRTVGDRGMVATTLNNIGMAWNGMGDKRKTLDCYEQTLPLYRAVGDRRGEATTLNNIGAAWSALGEPRKALDYYEQALPLYRAVGDRGGEAATLNNIGAAWIDLGEPRKALDYYEQALPLRRAVGDRGGEAATLNNMGLIYFQAGDLARTIAIQQQIIPIVQAIGAVADEAAYLFNIAFVYEKMGQLDDAIQSAEAGKAILVRHNLPQDAAGYRLADYDAHLARLRGAAAPSPSVSRLPQYAINQLAGNTVAVKTDLPDMLADWRVGLEGIRTDFASQGADCANETAFADTLLDVLCDQTAALPADNPYADVVRQVMAAIAAYHAGSG